MRFWFTDVGSSETQMCRLARTFAVRIMKPNLPFEPAHSQGLPVPLRGKRGTKRQYCLCSPFSLKIWPLFPCILEMNPPFPCSPKPQHVGVPQILVPIILIGTVTIQACMVLLRLTPFWSNYYRYFHFCGLFQRKHNRGDIRHKTNFRFLVNGGRSQIIAGEQRHYWGTS